MDKYIEDPNKKTIVTFKIEYYNTASSKLIFELFKKFEKLHSQGSEVTIKWYYSDDDEDMQEAGEDFTSLVSVPFELISFSFKK